VWKGEKQIKNFVQKCEKKENIQKITGKKIENAETFERNV
jgi:hypothetical protein